MKIVSWNVNGIRASYPKGLASFVQTYQPDILCLQETKAHLEQVTPEMRTLGYSFSEWSSANRKGYSGVATFSHTSPQQVTRGWGQSEYDQEGRIVLAQYPKFDLYNIYFPNGGSGPERHLFKQTFLKDLTTHLGPKLAAERPIIIVGDYNIAPQPMDVYDPIRLAKESGFLPEERQWFKSFFDLGFVDTFRHFNKSPQRYSWWSYRELARSNNRGWRIDFICITKNLLPYLKSAEVLDQVTGSDHCPVIAEFDFSLLK